MRTVTLYFNYGELSQVDFVDSTKNTTRRSVRGKTPGAYRSAGSFQWTSAVKALSLLLVKARIACSDSFIQGETGSMAASLDLAISKQPTWLKDMFGCDQDGLTLARRMILRTNPERKRPGPVSLGLNSNYLDAKNIAIIIDDKIASDEQLVSLHLALQL